ncbi:hypothetical protein [Paenibacillus silviterrae]|uniref:hypothetical protein n=1 Tax=Paenibacillus silviterrae TaxID=3242194 RepID=UPI0025437F8C|nr:hypothetical protein [Paenibacillus chinjuensis]
MQEKPYFCPNCRSNRVKFSMISSFSRRFLKDAVTGAVQEVGEPDELPEAEPTIQCQVCSFTGNELRFIKQAEREPRVMTQTQPISYQ